MSQTYFLTGALGCIGAWIVRQLIERGDRPVIFDPSDRDHRLRALLTPEQRAQVTQIRGDVTDGDAVRAALEESGARRIVHLAGLQVPVCKADPALGARVNVLGSIHVFEAARQLGIDRVVYASSAAVYGPGRVGEALAEQQGVDPATHYGVFKRANEGNARVYFLDHGISSVGLRPLTIYGVGRDFGMTSDPTRALKAAIVGRSFHVRFSGPTDFLYAADAAAAFLGAADHGPEGAHVFNVHGQTATVADFFEMAGPLLPGGAENITVDGPELPIAPELDGGALAAALPGVRFTSLAEGIRETIDRFVALRDAGELDTSELDD